MQPRQLHLSVPQTSGSAGGSRQAVTQCLTTLNSSAYTVCGFCILPSHVRFLLPATHSVAAMFFFADAFSEWPSVVKRLWTYEDSKSNQQPAAQTANRRLGPNCLSSFVLLIQSCLFVWLRSKLQPLSLWQKSCFIS